MNILFLFTSFPPLWYHSEVITEIDFALHEKLEVCGEVASFEVVIFFVAYSMVEEGHHTILHITRWKSNIIINQLVN